MKNLWTTIYVNNMDESVKFYTEILDLEIDKRYKPMDFIEFAFLGDGETKLELICDSTKSDIAYTDCVSTGFSVDNLDKFNAHLKSIGIELLGDIMQPSPALRFAFIKDPNGYRIQLVEFI